MNKTRKSAELILVRKPISELLPHPKNARQHDDRQINKLRHSIKVHGFAKGSVVIQKSTGYILAGHGIVEALRKEGYDSVDVVEVDLPDDKALAFLIADNHIAEQSTWDDIGLQNLINELSDLNVPALDFGFDDTDLQALADRILEGTGEAGEVAEDDFDTEQEIEPISKTGDLWLLGKHRVLCGDSTKAEDVARLMDGKKADMVFTDPPYGMNLDTDYSKMSGGDRKGKKWESVIGDNQEYDPLHIFDFFGDVKEIFLWGADYYYDKIPDAKLGSLVVWDKTLESNGDADYNSEFELMWSKQAHKRQIIHFNWFRFFGVSKQDIKTRIHPTQKPLQVVSPFIDKYSDIDNTILDLFLGSGTTLIACEQLGRVCYGMEIDAHYTDVIIKRYIDFKKSTDDVFLERNGVKMGYSEVVKDV